MLSVFRNRAGGNGTPALTGQFERRSPEGSCTSSRTRYGTLGVDDAVDAGTLSIAVNGRAETNVVSAIKARSTPPRGRRRFHNESISEEQTTVPAGRQPKRPSTLFAGTPPDSELLQATRSTSWSTMARR
jgi:hypothetical protein